MARVLVTIDYLDGRSVVKGPLHPDQIDTFGLLMKLAAEGIATVTFANAEPLTERNLALMSGRPDGHTD